MKKDILTETLFLKRKNRSTRSTNGKNMTYFTKLIEYKHLLVSLKMKK